MVVVSAFPQFLLISILTWAYSLDDKTVYLDRAVGSSTWEPRFVPKTMSAVVDEKVHFVLRLQPLVVPVRLLLF
jgi:hypothetical protein